MNVWNKRVIKLISPCGDLFHLELGGKESELKDLISSLCRISSTEIKGIKDKYGNYYTLSSVINNPSINSDLSDYFYLICGGIGAIPVSETNGNFQTSTCLARVDKSEMMKPKGKQSSIDVTFSQRNLLNKAPDFLQPFENPQNYFCNENIKRSSYSKNVPLFPFRNSIYNANPVQINQKPLLVKTCGASTDFAARKVQEELLLREAQFDKYNQTAKTLIKENLMEEKCLPILNQLIHEENTDILSLFRLFHQKVLDIKTLAESLNKILVRSSLYSNCQLSPTMQKNAIKRVLDSLESQFEDVNDINLLNRLVEFENEFILGAFALYETEKDIENLVDSLKRIVQRYKGKENTLAGNNLVASKQNIFRQISSKNQAIRLQYTEPHEKQKSSKTKVIPNSCKRLTDNTSEKKKSIERTSTRTISTQNSNTSPQEKRKQTLAFTKEVEIKILNKLHTVHRSLFKYALTSKESELSVFTQLYDIVMNEEILIKPIKQYCNHLLNDSVLKNLNAKQNERFNTLVKTKDKALLKILSEFDIHQSLELFQRDVASLIQNLDQDDKRKISSSSDSEMEEKESKMEYSEKNIHDAGNNNIGKNNIENEHDQKYQSIVNHLQLTDQEKKEILSKIRAGDKELLNIFEEYHRTNSLIALWYSLSNLMKKKSITEPKTIEEKKNPEPNIPISLETVLSTLEIDKKISSSQSSMILKWYKMGDEMINSFWEVYQNNLNMEELYESLKIYLTMKYKRRSSIEETNSGEKTPVSLSKNKNELIDFLKKGAKKTHDREEIKRKQNNVISILLREKYICSEIFEFIKSRIEYEDKVVTSAFEVYSVTKDHREFCETLGLITEIYNNNNNKSNGEKMKEQSKPFEILTQFITENSFSEKEREILKKIYTEKDEMIMSALEVYEKNSDEDELTDTLKLILKKHLQKK